MKQFGLILLLFVYVYNGFAQQKYIDKKAVANANNEIFIGNKSYENKDYNAAQKQYLKSLQSNPFSFPGNFNIGNTDYQLKKFDTARNAYNNALKDAKSKTEKAQANHNIGNTFLQQKKWQEAIDAYKNALRNNPNDLDSKYNLAYAQKMLKNQGGGGKDNKDKNKDKDNQDKNKDQQQNQNNQKDQQNKDQNQPKDNQEQEDKKEEGKKEDQQPQGMPSNISKDQADKILNALRQEEKMLQQDKKNKGVAPPATNDKDW